MSNSSHHSPHFTLQVLPYRNVLPGCPHYHRTERSSGGARRFDVLYPDGVTRSLYSRVHRHAYTLPHLHTAESAETYERLLQGAADSFCHEQQVRVCHLVNGFVCVCVILFVCLFLCLSVSLRPSFSFSLCPSLAFFPSLPGVAYWFC